MSESTVDIVIKAKNVTADAFAQVQSALRDVEGASVKTGAAGQKVGDGMATGLTSAKSALTSINGVLGVFGASLSVGALVSFGKAILDDTDNLVKMRDRTGITFQWLQKFQIAGDDAGNTVDEMAQAVNLLQKKMGTDPDSLQSVLKLTTAEFTEFKSRRPEEQFVAISDAVRRATSETDQVKIATEAFGKSGIALLPTLKRGFDDLKGAVVGMTDETILAADKAGDRLAAMWRGFKAEAANKIVAVVDFPTADLEAATAKGKIAFDGVRQKAIELTDQMKALGETAPALEVGFSTSIKAVIDATPHVKSYVEQVADAHRQVGLLSESQKANIVAALELGHKQDDLATEFHVSATAIGLVKEADQAATAATKEHANAIEAQAKKLAEANDHITAAERGTQALTRVQEIQIEHYDRIGVSAADAATALGLETVVVTEYLKKKDGYDKLTASVREAETAHSDLATALKGFGTVVVPTSHDLDAYNEHLEQGARTLDDYYASLQRGHDAMVEWQAALPTWKSAVTSAFADLPSLLTQSFIGGGGVDGAVRAFGVELGTSLFGKGGAFEDEAKKATQGLQNIFGKTIGGALGAAIPGLGAAVGPALSALWGGIKRIFGGPSGGELQGRELVASFESQIAAGLTNPQKQRAEGESWKKTAIGIADAYAAQGIGPDVASRDTEALWASSRTGDPTVTRKVVEMIQAKMEGWWWGDPASSASGASGGSVGPIDDGIPRDADGNPLLRGGGAADFGAGAMAILHGREAVVPLDKRSDIGDALVRGITGANLGGSGKRIDDLERSLAELARAQATLAQDIVRGMRDSVLMAS